MQVSDEMVEKAARAVYAVSVKAIEPALGIPVCKFEDLPERDLNLHQDYARAAITAALADHVVVPREPTAEMYAAWMCNHRDWSARYRAMIDAAPQVSRGE